MTSDRFIIHTALGLGAFLDATTDEHGRPGDLSQILPPHSKVVSAVSLPVDGHTRESFPEAFRLLVFYRVKVD